MYSSNDSMDPKPYRSATTGPQRGQRGSAAISLLITVMWVFTVSTHGLSPSWYWR